MNATGREIIWAPPHHFIIGEEWSPYFWSVIITEYTVVPCRCQLMNWQAGSSGASQGVQGPC